MTTPTLRFTDTCGDQYLTMYRSTDENLDPTKIKIDIRNPVDIYGDSDDDIENLDPNENLDPDNCQTENSFNKLTISEPNSSQVVVDATKALKPSIKDEAVKTISIYDEILTLSKEKREIQQNLKDAAGQVTILDLRGSPVIENMAPIFELFKNVIYLYYAKNVSTNILLRFKNTSPPLSLKNVNFSQFKRLRLLELQGCKDITRTTLANLAPLKQLQHLNLSKCNIENSFLIEIGKITNLKHLNLSFNSDITDDSLKFLTGLTKLKTLYLIGCNKITDKGLKHISRLKNLSNLNLSGCNKITKAGLSSISKLRDLSVLDLSFNESISNTDLLPLTRLQNLYILELQGCNKLTNSCLVQIAKITNIQIVNLWNCKKLTYSGLMHFKEQIRPIHVMENVSPVKFPVNEVDDSHDANYPFLDS